MSSDEENEAIIDFEREVEDGRLLKSDIVLSLDTGLIIKNLLKKQQKAIDKMSKELSKAGMYKSNVSAYEIYEKSRNVEMVKMTPEEIKKYFMEE